MLLTLVKIWSSLTFVVFLGLCASVFLGMILWIALSVFGSVNFSVLELVSGGSLVIVATLLTTKNSS